MSTAEKKVVSVAEFEKRVEIEAANLMHFDRLKKDEAFEKARKEIATRFIAEDK